MNYKRIFTLTAAAMLAACQATGGSSGSQNTDASSATGQPATQKFDAENPENISHNQVVINQSRRAIAERWADESFEAFEQTVTREEGTGYYIVNGDIVIDDRKQLEVFFEDTVKKATPEAAGLTLAVFGGVDAKWNDTDKHNLTYCVSNSFGNRKARVVADMAAAAKAWSDQGDVRFIHSSGQDANCNAFNNQVMFDVRPVSSGNYLARAFFPNDPRSRRNVLIDDSSFNTANPNLTLRGILRHELGHVLGFRHEHTRPEAGACFEDNNWRPLTSYDAYSVMHYPQCNGLGDWSLILTNDDKNGICKIYGAGPAFEGDQPAICAAAATPPASTPDINPTCERRTAEVTGSVIRHETAQLGDIDLQAGEQLTVTMSGSGDPDLYVRLGQEPTLTGYHCRPYRTGPNERCVLDAPSGSDIKAFIMVRGYTAGTYQLEIEVEAP